MKSEKELENLLHSIDNSGYGAYMKIKGAYRLRTLQVEQKQD